MSPNGIGTHKEGRRRKILRQRDIERIIERMDLFYAHNPKKIAYEYGVTPSYILRIYKCRSRPQKNRSPKSLSTSSPPTLTT